MRAAIYWLGALVALGSIHWAVAAKVSILRSGETVLLELRPRDPRSLLQGDYMQLAYAIESSLPRSALPDGDGRLVLRLDSQGVATFARVHAGEALAPDERLLRYRWRGRLRLGAESFFFQEGHGDAYARARFGELRVAPDGDSVLVGLRDEARQRIEPPADAAR